MSARARIAEADELLARAGEIVIPEEDREPGIERLELVLRALVTSNLAVAEATVESGRRGSDAATLAGIDRRVTGDRPYSGD